MNKKLFDETYQNIKNGVHNHEFISLINWIKTEFNIDVYNITYEVILTDKLSRLNFILKTTEDLAKFRENLSNYGNERVVTFFREHYSALNNYTTKEVHITSEPFDRYLVDKLSTKLAKLMGEIVDNHDEIWTIKQMNLSFTCFTYKQNQINHLSSYSNQFRKLFFDVIKLKDEFDIFNIDKIHIFFDSKEVFDEKYRGNWRRYFN